jgi:hypothetical protein
MTGTLKPDAAAIVAHIANLKNQSWLSKSQYWWPDFLFHFTDIQNAVSVLKQGTLFSRNKAKELGLMATDNASPSVMAGTGDKWKNYVRLYFRPRTPTQYQNEGFRPLGQRKLGAHCPVPIVFLFDAKQILIRATTLFSEGNLAANAATGESAAFLASIPFQKVYHSSPLGDDEKRSIIFHRHAEIIVPDSLELSSLKSIWCRSQAEFETLNHLLPRKISQRWAKKIGVGNKLLLFYACWPFIEKADLTTTAISFSFNPCQTSGPFMAKFEIQEVASKKIYFWEKSDFYTKNPLSFSLRNTDHPEAYTVSFWLDGQLAYQNSYFDESGIPF